ncbi:MAG: TIGR01212 family radical SAM protein [Lachnospiraceae bacterium]|nr:TIGR01212 family radical SAM protein [Lachnospiraceae bacterium]
MEQILRLNNYFKERFGTKVYKVSLNGNMTCPNRDGTISTGGCIFCSEGGSGDFSSSPDLTISAQIDDAVKRVGQKIKNGKYIAYFQAYTNTYAPVSYLRNIFFEAIAHPDIVGISIATRPDCLPEDVLNLLNELNHIKPVFVELGLQTSNSDSARLINRGYDNSTFENAVYALNNINIEIVVHMIIGIPGEQHDDIMNTINYINKYPIKGIKLQLLHVLKHTALEQMYKDSPELFHYMNLNDYVEILGECIELLRPDIVIHRLTGDGPKSILLAPEWSGNKKKVLNTINGYMSGHNITQGRKYLPYGT